MVVYGYTFMYLYVAELADSPVLFEPRNGRLMNVPFRAKGTVAYCGICRISNLVPCRRDTLCAVNSMRVNMGGMRGAACSSGGCSRC